MPVQCGEPAAARAFVFERALRIRDARIPVPASVEKGCFGFYEVKSCMADFTSGNGLTFYGDQNYLVCTKELCDEIVWQKMVPERVNAILTPDSTGSKLIYGHVQSYNDMSYRRRPASEILWAMVKANGRRTN